MELLATRGARMVTFMSSTPIGQRLGRRKKNAAVLWSGKRLIEGTRAEKSLPIDFR